MTKHKSTGTCLLILALVLVASLVVAQESSKARSKFSVRQRISNVSAFDDQAESLPLTSPETTQKPSMSW